jgi:hypothetical protein
MVMAAAATKATVEDNCCDEGNGVVDEGGKGKGKGRGGGNGCGEGSGIGNDGTEGNVGGACRGVAKEVAIVAVRAMMLAATAAVAPTMAAVTLAAAALMVMAEARGWQWR